MILRFWGFPALRQLILARSCAELAVGFLRLALASLATPKSINLPSMIDRAAAYFIDSNRRIFFDVIRQVLPRDNGFLQKSRMARTFPNTAA